MIRQKWLPHTRAIFAAQKRCLSSPSSGFPRFVKNDESWGDLKEKLNSSLARASPGGILKPKPVTRNPLKEAMAEDLGSRQMLVIEGLPTSLGHGSNHVLLELPRASFSASELKAIIKQDGIESGHDWQMDVFSLRETMDFEKGFPTNTRRVPLYRSSPEFRHKLDSRFVLTCANPEVAWRFIRNWNQRILEYDGGDEVFQRNRVKASYIET
ncbi:unnamed protein product [Fusarium fujikuroi]|nr:unnamed protein product [Fusarium fujikuroi]